MGIVLRDYQDETIESIVNQWSRGYHSTLANLFTGAGKTVIFVEYCKRHIDLKRQRVLVITPAHLTLKTKFKFIELYPETYARQVLVNGYKMMPALGMEMSNVSEPQGRIIVSSADTLIDRVTEDYEPIRKEDILVEAQGIRLNPASKRRYLVSRRVDELLKYGMFDELIDDECFPAGTLIDGRPIETVQVGDIISSYDEVSKTIVRRQVTHLYKRTPKHFIVSLSMSDGRTISCTENHPIYVNGRWTNSINVRVGDYVYASNLQNELLSVRSSDGITTTKRYVKDFIFDRKTKTNVLLQQLQRLNNVGRIFTNNVKDKHNLCIRPDETKQPDEGLREFREDATNAFENRSSTRSTWRKWSGVANSPTNVVREIGRKLVSRVRSTVKSISEKQLQCKSSIQDRYSEPRLDGSHRSRWSESSNERSSIARQEERLDLKRVRVDSVTVHEQTSDGTFGGLLSDGHVYNLEVEGTHTYFANGILVHNCHHVLADSEFTLVTRLWEICDAIGIPKVKVTGYTATAFREDGKALGNVFQTICISRSAAWGQQNGYLAPLAVPIRVEASIPYGRSKVLKVGNWTQPIITAWKEKAELRPTLGYFDSVSSSIEATEKFREAGIRSAHIDGTQTIDTDGKVYGIDYRETIYNKFLTGEVQVLNNYAVLLEGVDLPPASCMIWARPTENLVLLTQAVGRILRLFDGNKDLPEKTDALIIDIVGDDMTVMTAGTLSGYRVDPNSKEYVKDVDDEMEVETVVDGRELRDVGHGLTEANGVIYSVGKLIRKSGSDWYHNDSNDVQTLGISTNEALTIVPPFFTLANHLARKANLLETQIASGDQSLMEDYTKLQRSIELYSNYTLWHSKESDYPKTWVYQDVSLERLMDFAVPYMSEVSNPISSFVARGKKWKTEPITKTQIEELRRLAYLYKFKVIDSTTKGEASQLITYHKHFNGIVRQVLGFMYRELGSYTK